jgi:MoaA/NifB/PqqE/SkfB family radical SAM enzyme
MERYNRWQDYTSEPGISPSSVQDSKTGTNGLRTRSPIERWLELIYAQDVGDCLERLRAIYRDNFPTQGELIFTGACEFTCQHCIYPPDYVKFNPGLSPNDWQKMLGQLHRELGINTFVHGGRSLTRSGVEVLADLRKLLPEACIGLIDNGISLKPYRDELAALQLDWIDISFDGMERDHDVQRGKSGSFAAAFQGALWLKEHGIASKINILTCLTTLNQNSVIEMIRFLNRQGFKNIFIVPVSILDQYRPSPDLMVSGQALTALIEDIEAVVPSLEDAWIELLFFEVKYVEFIGKYCSHLWERFGPEHDHLTWKMSRNGNDFSMSYYPFSLTGVRELIINSNGDVILPKVMAKGKISTNEIIGNLLKEGSLDIVRRLPDASQFEFYREQLLKEQQIIRSITCQSPTLAL